MRRVTMAGVAVALLLPLTLTACGRLSGGTSEPAPAPSQSETVEVPAADLTGLEGELDDIDSLLDDSTSDLDAAQESAALED